MLGTARIACEKVIPATQRAARCEVVAIASRDATRARTAARRLGIQRAHLGYERLLADPAVDAVYIPLPNHLHGEWTMRAAEAGKHVLCEKPLALNAAEARRMVDRCRRAGVVLMEAFMYRLHPSWRAARRLVSEGGLGELRAVQSWFSYYNDDPRNIRNVLDYGGGALMDIGCYPINLSRWLFGAEPTRVTSTIRRDRDSGVDVATSATLEFGSGEAAFSCSTRCEPDQRVHLYGSRARLAFEIPFNIPADRPVRLFLSSRADPAAEAASETLVFPPVDQYTVQAEAFARTVLDGQLPPVPAEDSVANMRVLDRILAAAEGPSAA